MLCYVMFSAHVMLCYVMVSAHVMLPAVEVCSVNTHIKERNNTPGRMHGTIADNKPCIKSSICNSLYILDLYERSTNQYFHSYVRRACRADVTVYFARRVA